MVQHLNSPCTSPHRGEPADSPATSLAKVTKLLGFMDVPSQHVSWFRTRPRTNPSPAPIVLTADSNPFTTVGLKRKNSIFELRRRTTGNYAGRRKIGVEWDVENKSMHEFATYSQFRAV